MALAPNAFGGTEKGQLLVGNHGDGKIWAYDLDDANPTATATAFKVRNGNGTSPPQRL